jgi:oligoribonuclease
MKRAKLLWIDLEMTGLDPEKDRILELAAIATGWDLESIEGKNGEAAEMTAVVKVPEKLMKERMVGEFWEKNAESRDGLMKQNMEGKSAKEVEDELLEFIDKWFGASGEVILAGNSIHQDRKFIDREWPRVAERLHYRMLDVSAWKAYFEGARGKKFTKREAHRALDDIRGSIEELKWYVGELK